MLARTERQGMHKEFCEKISCKMTIWKTKNEMRGKIKMDTREISCEDGRQIELVQECVQW
jgi:hypothetical protein